MCAEYNNVLCVCVIGYHVCQVKYIGREGSKNCMIYVGAD